MDKRLLETIKKDLIRYGVTHFSKRVLVKKVLADSIIRFVVFHRLVHHYESHNQKVHLFFLKVLRKLGFINYHHSEIPYSVEFGPGLYIGHFYNITINAKAKLGSNINIHKGVTIGQENRGLRKGAPVIGSNVYLGINSVIVGNIRIGDNVLIAANSFVNSDVPSNSIVFGNPAQIKTSVNATVGYINNVC